MNKNGPVDPLDSLILEIKALRDIKGLTWREITAWPKFKGVSAGTLFGIVASGRASNETRRKLGLPPRAIEVEPCPECGEVHVVGWCTKHGPPAVKGRTPSNRKRRKRHRLHYEAGYDGWGLAKRKEIELAMEKYGVGSFTELVDCLLSAEK